MDLQEITPPRPSRKRYVLAAGAVAFVAAGFALWKAVEKVQEAAARSK